MGIFDSFSYHYCIINTFPATIIWYKMNLTTKQLKFLKAKAHDYKPVVIIGNAGLTDGVTNETNIVLETHELVKVKVNASDKEQRLEIIQKLSTSTESNFVQLIGKIAILYRARKKSPEIILPKK